jgi:hypothetical protein
MNVSDALVLISFIAGLVPALLLLTMYGIRVDWRATYTGRTIFYLFLVITTTYSVTVLFLLFPEHFEKDGGLWFRILVRLAIASALWKLFLLFLKAQYHKDQEDP